MNNHFNREPLSLAECAIHVEKQTDYALKEFRKPKPNGFKVHEYNVGSHVKVLIEQKPSEPDKNG